MSVNSKFDVIVIGGGAAGLMAAWQSGLRGRNVLLIEKHINILLSILYRLNSNLEINFLPFLLHLSNPHSFLLLFTSFLIQSTLLHYLFYTTTFLVLD